MYSMNLERRDVESCAYFQAPSCVPVDSLDSTTQPHPKLPLQGHIYKQQWLYSILLSLQSSVSEVIVYNPLVGQVHVSTFTTQECSMINSQHYLYIAYGKLHVIVALQWRQNVFLTRQIKNVCPFSCGAMANFWFLPCMHVSASFSWLYIYSQKAIWKVKSGKIFFEIFSTPKYWRIFQKSTLII
jgi:hypothetical protein